MSYRFIFRHVIQKIDPEQAHNHTMRAMALVAKIPGAIPVIRTLFARGVGTLRGPWVENTGKFAAFARPLPGRFGLPAGLDKEAQAIETLAALGFSFIEIGTITPRPQPGNDKPRLWRLVEQRAIRNRMGFNNQGALAARKRLQRLRLTRRGRSAIVGANIGKNKTTPLDQAVSDYRIVARELAQWVDYMVVNVSSPNTPGLRTLQDASHLRPIMEAVRDESTRAAGRRVPLFVKIAPDLHDDDIIDIADMARTVGLDGIIATNTTIDHDYGEGGLSGPPVKQKALHVVKKLREVLGDDLIIIGCGGVETLEDARELRDAGADLVQGYTAFIYNGPAWPAQINSRLR